MEHLQTVQHIFADKLLRVRDYHRGYSWEKRHWNDFIEDLEILLKEKLLKINHNLIFNPQKYYISIVHKKNVAFFIFRKKKFRLVIMLPEAEIKRKIHKHKIKSLSEAVQKFYNGPCAEVIVEGIHNLKEVIDLLKTLTSTNSI